MALEVFSWIAMDIVGWLHSGAAPGGTSAPGRLNDQL